MFGGGLPHDAMHDILEGIGPLVLQLLDKAEQKKAMGTLGTSK